MLELKVIFGALLLCRICVRNGVPLFLFIKEKLQPSQISFANSATHFFFGGEDILCENTPSKRKSNLLFERSLCVNLKGLCFFFVCVCVCVLFWVLLGRYVKALVAPML